MLFPFGIMEIFNEPNKAIVKCRIGKKLQSLDDNGLKRLTPKVLQFAEI